MIILIPKSARSSSGHIPMGLSVAFAFLAITFTAQGLFTRNPLWTLGGLLFSLLTGWQLLSRFGPSLKTPSQIKLQITPEVLTVISGPPDAPMRRHWPRAAISRIRSEPPMLNVYLKNRDAPVRLLSGLEPAELDWIADQIRIKWGIEKY